ncbi:hypothetical protein EAE99_005148 [Botrytis elliptica]|nr:hypothetical protein EAE99_005148 [Botrytis elliptica]
MQSLGEVTHKDKLREVDSGSPIRFSCSSASPVPLSSGQNDDLQGMSRSSRAIVHGSCLVKGAPSCDKAKAKFDELGRYFPSDLPYIITYENGSLEAICQECSRRLKIEGSALGGIINHATGTPHGFNVKQRLDSNNLEETLTSKVMTRRKAMEIQSEPNPFREVPNRRRSENIEPWEFSSIEVDPARPVDHSEPEPRKSKRQKVAPAFLAETNTSDLQVSTGLKNPVELIVADISERLTDINHQFDQKIKKQRDQTLLFNADLIGLRNFHGKRLDTLEQISEKQKHELKVCNENFRESKAQTDASLQKDKISLANIESELEEQKGCINNTINLVSDTKCKVEGQKKVMDNLADLFPDLKSELKEQKQVVNILASKLESGLKGQKETTTNLAELMDNRLTGQKRKVDHLMTQLKNLGDSRESEDLLRLHTENELQTHQMQIANLEQKISCTSQVSVDRIIDFLAVEPQLQRCKQYAELLEKQAVDFRPYMDRIVRLEDNISDFRNFKDKLDSLETCTRGFQKWLDEMACESAEYRLQQDHLSTEFLERQALESQNFMERIVNLEKNTTDITRLVEENKVSGESMRKFMLKFRSTSDQITQLRKEVQSYDSKLGAVSVALDNRRLQQLKEHTELIEEKMSHTQTDLNNMVTKFMAELSDFAVQAARSEIIGKIGSRDHQIDDLVQSIRPIMLRLAGLESTEKQSDEMVMVRLAALEKNEKQSDNMTMIRLAALEEKNERHVSRILELERGNESLQREVMKLQQPIAK